MKKIRLWIETILVKFGVWLLPKLSRKQVHALSQVMGWVAYGIDYRGRATAHENLRVAFAKERITPDQVRAIARGSYQNFARTFLDLFWSPKLQKDKSAIGINTFWDSTETLQLAKERGSLWITAHFGSFELLSFHIGSFGFRFTTIAQDFKNEALTQVFADLRQGSGHTVIPQQGAMLRFVKELRRGGHASMLSDLTVKPGRSGGVITCFGLKTCAPLLHTQLAHRLNLLIIPAVAVPVGSEDLQCHIFAPLEPKSFADPVAMAQAIWDQFELKIRKNPECWLWMYKHWRYLPGTEEDTRYPNYANANRGFQKLVKGEPVE